MVPSAACAVFSAMKARPAIDVANAIFFIGISLSVKGIFQIPAAVAG
jgi:hypothetical protein